MKREVALNDMEIKKALDLSTKIMDLVISEPCDPRTEEGRRNFLVGINALEIARKGVHELAKEDGLTVNIPENFMAEGFDA